MFDIKTSLFWEDHYNFGSISKKRSKFLTKSFIDLLMINTIIPLKFIYFKHIGRLSKESILSLSEQIKPERNNIISKFEIIFNKNKIKSHQINNAFESQAYLQLKSAYCDKNICLQCAIGNSILKNKKILDRTLVK